MIPLVSILDLMDCRVKTIWKTVSLICHHTVSILDLMDCRVKTGIYPDRIETEYKFQSLI